uniref:DUF4283 domain-containing protein n=1 Tax=Solanum tuberosum TaxID=4113 RepID=M1DWH4_SOLTU
MAGITSSGVNSIYYNARFKSYEITRCKDGTDSWYEWTESSRNLVRRVKISIKVLRWLVSIFIEASKVQGKVFRRWKLKEHFAEFYCSLKYNENGRFVSFIAIQGQNKSIIITPEASYMGGWSNIVHKIAKFIYEPNLQPKPQVNMGKQSNTSYREAVQSSRWMTDSMKRAKLHVKEAHIEVTSGAPLAETDLLNRCIVGRFQDTSQTPALNNVRRCACNTWKSAIGVNVFAMNDGQFLFELPSRVAAEHVMSGVWVWKKMNLSLYWWKPTTGCWPDEVKRDWTRIKVKDDGEKVPREVKISSDGYAYKVPIWCEAPVTVRKVETRRENEDREPLGKEVSRSSTMEKPTARDRSWKGKGQLHAVAGQISERRNQGPKKALGQTRFKQKESSQESQRLDLVSVEIMANLSQTKTQNRFKNLDNLEVEEKNFMPREQEEPIQEEGENTVTVAKATNMGKQIMAVSQLNGQNDSNTENTENDVPLMIHFH